MTKPYGDGRVTELDYPCVYSCEFVCVYVW